MKFLFISALNLCLGLTSISFAEYKDEEGKLSIKTFEKYATQNECEKDYSSFRRCLRFMESLKDPTLKTYFVPKKVSEDFLKKLKESGTYSVQSAYSGVWVSFSQAVAPAQKQAIYSNWKNAWKNYFLKNVKSNSKNKISFENFFSDTKLKFSQQTQSFDQQKAFIQALSQGFIYYYEDPHLTFETVEQLKISRGIVLETQTAPQVVESKTLQNGEKGIGYLKLKSFLSVHACEQLKLEIESIRKLNQNKMIGWILDLRGNGGGKVSQANCIAGIFLGAGEPVFRTVEFEGIPFQDDHFKKMKDLFQTFAGLQKFNLSVNPKSTAELSNQKENVVSESLVVLVDQRSASASEMLSGLLQETGRGFLIGAPTYGKGCFQTTLPFSEIPGILLRKTVGWYVLPSGRSPQISGIQPDLVTEENEVNSERRLTPPSLPAFNISNFEIDQNRLDKVNTCVTQDGSRDPTDLAERAVVCLHKLGLANLDSYRRK